MDDIDIVEGILNKNKRIIAQSISKIDDEDPLAHEILRKIYPNTGKAVTIGFTGPAGAGKSTIIGKLIFLFQEFWFQNFYIGSRPYKFYFGRCYSW